MTFAQGYIASALKTVSSQFLNKQCYEQIAYYDVMDWKGP